jgi:periplasmic glucans biosynthesis protein
VAGRIALQWHGFREFQMDRRTWLKLAASATALSATPFTALAQGNSLPSLPFSEDMLDAMARKLANDSYKPWEKHVDEALAALPHDAYSRSIVYKEDQALWVKEQVAFRLMPYHTAGSYYAYPIELYSVESGQAIRIPYTSQAFDFYPPAKQPATATQSDFAGFHVQAQIDRLGVFRDFLSFLGATNFKAIGSGQVFGVSARALAINTGQPGGEDFPLFRSFWIERPKPTDPTLVIHALLDSINAVGRLKLTAAPGYNTVIETEVVIYPRKRIAYAGIAPIASRFFFGPGVPPKRRDYRPRVHDSEALYILNGAGEQIWRPLLNPERLQFSVFVDKGPKGFGLMQRERYFASYQDADLQHEKRPSLWIEPIGDWGEGSIDLIELPAPEEFNENIVCFWRPKDGLGPGIGHRYRYRMHWCWSAPFENRKAVIAQTRVGETKSGDALFVLDFFNAESCADCNGAPVTANVTASAGEVRNVRVAAAPTAGAIQRLRFEYTPSGSDPVDLRAQLTANGKPVSDAWIFRWAR